MQTCDAAHPKGDFATVGFLRYEWKHSKNDDQLKKAIRIFSPFSIFKFECLDQVW